MLFAYWVSVEGVSMTQEMKSVSRVCPYCGGIVSKRGWIVSSERLTADGYTEQIDQLVHKKCQSSLKWDFAGTYGGNRAGSIVVMQEKRDATGRVVAKRTVDGNTGRPLKKR